MKQATLKFCGIKPVRVTRIDQMKYKNEQQREKILKKIAGMVK